MDMYTFQYHYKDRLSKLNVKYVVQRRFPMTDYHYGISFYDMDQRNPPYATPTTWRTCLEEYIEYNYHFKEKMERHYREKFLKDVSLYLTLPGEKMSGYKLPEKKFRRFTKKGKNFNPSKFSSLFPNVVFLDKVSLSSAKMC